LNLVSTNILDGYGAKAMPGWIHEPFLVHLRKIRKIHASQMGHTKKKV